MANNRRLLCLMTIVDDQQTGAALLLDQSLVATQAHVLIHASCIPCEATNPTTNLNPPTHQPISTNPPTNQSQPQAQPTLPLVPVRTFAWILVAAASGLALRAACRARRFRSCPWESNKHGGVHRDQFIVNL